MDQLILPWPAPSKLVRGWPARGAVKRHEHPTPALPTCIRVTRHSVLEPLASSELLYRYSQLTNRVLGLGQLASLHVDAILGSAPVIGLSHPVVATIAVLCVPLWLVWHSADSENTPFFLSKYTIGGGFFSPHYPGLKAATTSVRSFRVHP